MEDIKGEIWKPIIYNGIDFSGSYEVSNLGRVKNIKTNKMLRIGMGKYYKFVNIYFNKKPYFARIHRLVACNFIGIPKDDLNEVIDHINSDKTDNRLENLRIVSKRENCSKEKCISSGLPTGVCFYNKKYRARIKIDGGEYFLGIYDSDIKASKAYEIALCYYNLGFEINNILRKIDDYRLSIGLNPIKRK